jgi:phosphoglycolate phosphatase
MKLIFDLDGTLICSKKRLHELFCDLVGNRELSFNTYWELKFDRNSNQDILRNRFDYSDEKVDVFVADWMSKIESDYYLNMDSPIEGLQNFLQEVGKNNQLYVCTARQSVSQVTKQLKEFSVLDLFHDIFVTEQKYSKIELLINSGIVFSSDDWFIGDTGHDINTGKQLGVQTCAVLSGFMSEEVLKTYLPDTIIANTTCI